MLLMGLFKLMGIDKISEFNIGVLAYKLTFYGSHGCPSCALTLPLLSLAQKRNLIQEIEVEFLDKEQYNETLSSLLLEFPRWLQFWNKEKYGIPKPMIFLQVKPHLPITLVRPEITLSIVDKIQEFLQSNGGDLAVLAWLDDEFEFKSFFINLLIEMVSNVITPN